MIADAHPPATPSGPHPRRRWWTIVVIVALALGAYALVLDWAARRLETGVEHSIHPLPAVLRADHAGAANRRQE